MAFPAVPRRTRPADSRAAPAACRRGVRYRPARKRRGEGIGVGAVLGALLAAATSIAIHGIGLIVAGPIAGALAGAGGAAGTLIGYLIGAGIPEERAKAYDEGIRSGGIVLGTRARDDAHATELEKDFTTHGGRHIVR